MGVFRRFDAGVLDKAERTPQGGLRVPAFVTRTGIFEYKLADGTIQRELRPEEEVFHADALATLEDAPVTDLHPASFVSPTNYRELERGHARNVSRKDEFVAATLVVQDADMIRAIEAGERSEISLGYTCDLDFTPGEFNGQKYDAVQRKIRNNHVAVGPSKWGRAGEEVRMRLDSTGNALPAGTQEPSMSAKKKDEDAPAATSDKPEVAAVAKDADPMVAVPGEKCPCCGQMVPKAETETVAVADKDPNAEPAPKMDSKLLARLDALEASNKQLKADLAKANDPKVRADEAAAFAGLRDLAKSYGCEKLDGTVAELNASIVAKAFPTIKLDGKDATYVATLVEAAREQAPARIADNTVRTIAAPKAARNDAADADPIAAAKARIAAAGGSK